MKPVIRASICTGEEVAGFKDIRTGKIRRDHADQISRGPRKIQRDI